MTPESRFNESSLTSISEESTGGRVTCRSAAASFASFSAGDASGCLSIVSESPSCSENQ